MAEQFTNNAQTTLNGAIDNSTGSIIVTSAAGFPTSGEFRVFIKAEGSNTDEICTVTAVSGTTFTVLRASEAIGGTQASSAHASGAEVIHVLTAGSINRFLPDSLMTSTGDMIYEAGGLDKALSKSVTVSGTGDGMSGSRAVDGNDSTQWRSNSGTSGHWIRVDLASSLTIASFRILLTSESNRRWYSYKIQSSTNDSDWTDRHTVSGPASVDSGVTALSSGNISARYWRWYATGGSGSGGSEGYGGDIFTFALFDAVIPSRLSIGNSNDVLTVSSGIPTWVGSYVRNTTISPSSDTYIDKQATTTNYDSNTTLVIGNKWGTSDYTRFGLLTFDTAALAGKTIHSAILQLVRTDSNALPVTFLQARRILRAYHPTQVTWDAYSTGNNWTTAGAESTGNDVAAGAYGDHQLQNTPGYATNFIRLDITGLVQEDIDNSSTTLRIILGTTNADGSINAVSIASLNNATVAYRPKLFVTYV